MRFSPPFEIAATSIFQVGVVRNFQVRTPMTDQISKVVLAECSSYRKLGTRAL